MPRQPSYTTALNRALDTLDAQPADGAAVRLARGYAAAIDDDPECLPKVGPLLLAALAALGLTPAARRQVAGKGVDHGSTGASPLDELRDRRQRRAAALDAPAG